MKLTQSENHFFLECAGELLKSRNVRLMDTFIQHADVSCLRHSISVAYTSFWMSEKLNLRVDRRSLIRGALLHDFFLYDWHLKSGRKGLHGFTHPKIALQNAQREFELNDREKDIIVKHMWPLTLVPPRYREAYIVMLSDKFCSLLETLGVSKGSFP